MDARCSRSALFSTFGRGAAVLFGMALATTTLAADNLFVGQWRGQIQYQVTVKGETQPDAHAVIGFSLVIEDGLRVSGVSPENGCRLLGIAAPTPTGNRMAIDVTLYGCRYPALNRRLTGTLTVSKTDGRANLDLVEQVYSAPATRYEAKATLSH